MSNNYLLSGRVSGRLSGPLGASGGLGSGTLHTAGSGAASNSPTTQSATPLHSTSGRFSGRFATTNTSGRLSRPPSGRFPSGNIEVLDTWLKELDDVTPGSTSANNLNHMAATEFNPTGNKRIRNSSVRTLLDSSMDFTGQTIFTEKPATKRPAHLDLSFPPADFGEEILLPPQPSSAPAFSAVPPELRVSVDQPQIDPHSPLAQLVKDTGLGRPASARPSAAEDPLVRALAESANISTPKPHHELDTLPGFRPPGAAATPVYNQQTEFPPNNTHSPGLAGRLGRGDGPLRGPRIIRNATPSHFCHICSRCDDVVRTLTCKNIIEGKCRKVICEKCFDKYGYDWQACCANIENWQCTHCAGTCPERARCSIYTKTNSIRQITNTIKKGVTKLGGGGGNVGSNNSSGILGSSGSGGLRMSSPRAANGFSGGLMGDASGQHPTHTNNSQGSSGYPSHPVVSNDLFPTNQPARAPVRRNSSFGRGVQHSQQNGNSASQPSISFFGP